MIYQEIEYTGWGKFPKAQRCKVLRPEYQEALKIPSDSLIARGCGRSYGDAAVNSEGYTCLTEKLSRILLFDRTAGVITVEAGVTLRELIPLLLKAGWFLPVTPGTQFVTIGGCIAADVHGKNHHLVGSFGSFVTEMKLLLADQSVVHCSLNQHPELFKATIGGMGWTGLILEATFQLIPALSSEIEVQKMKTGSLAETLSVLSENSRSTYSVAWLDGFATGSRLGRGIVMLGEHSSKKGEYKQPSIHPKKIPAKALSFGLLSPTVKIFNTLYFHSHRKREQASVNLLGYFYPLDLLENWNGLYGRKGFFQYQCVIPPARALEALEEILKLTQNQGYLIVLKQMGPQRRGYLSFPMEGWTIAIDCPAKDKMISLLPLLDAITLRYEGRVYLAKDTHLTAETFRTMYPEFESWLQVKKTYDPAGYFSSNLFRRIHGKK